MAGPGNTRRTSGKRLLEVLPLLVSTSLGGIDLREYEIHLEHKLKTTTAQAQM